MKKSLGRTRQYQLQRYQALCNRIGAAGLPLPRAEMHSRPLYRLLDSDQVTVWRRVLDNYPPDHVSPYFVDRLVTEFLKEKLEKLLRPAWNR